MSSLLSETEEARFNELADRLFTSLREGDYDGAAKYFAPEATWWMNSEFHGPVSEVLPQMKAKGSPVGDHTHEETRRLFGKGGFVEQHTTRWKGVDGQTRELAVCAVVRVGSDGLVTRFEEYYDGAALTAATATSTLTAIQRVEEHVHSEYRNKVDEIVPTISNWDVQYALLARTRSGLVLEEVYDKAQATVYYTGTREAYNIVTSYHLNEVNTSWYSFHESIGHLTHIGMLEDVAPTGKDLFVPSAVLFPVWPDGIIGEIQWTRFDLAEVARGNTKLGTAPPALAPYVPSRQMRNARLHDDFVRAWREGEVQAMVATLDDECCSAIRTAEIAGEGRTRNIAKTKDEHKRYFSSEQAFRPSELIVTNRVTADWYVFAEYLLRLEIEGRAVRRELAVLYPVTEDGRLVGQLAYGLDRRG